MTKGYPQNHLDNGVLPNPKDLSAETRTYRNGNWADILAKGENPKGFTAFTPNGPSRVPENGLVYEDNYGSGENGDHSEWGISAVSAVSVTPVSRKKKGA